MSRAQLFSAAVAAVLLASPLAAQRVTDQSPSFLGAPSALQAPALTVQAPASTAQAPAVTPTLASAQADVAVGAHAVAMTTPFAPAPAPRAYGRSPALMIVGGAMLLVGAVIGGDAGTIVMLGGGGLGLLGLWTYLR